MWSGGGRTHGAGILACQDRLQPVLRGRKFALKGTAISSMDFCTQ